ncbi:PilZ domain-containing protein [Lysobacter sp. A3-1-A15]|uniref:PilZ domain-containing protein n=1 Tax=Novilysobacter viscosus TaxID=3098602 RepID=UPI002ED8613C
MNDEFRRVRRRKVPDNVQVVDTMTERVVGRLSNLSESGMLLMASVPLVEDALYQFRFDLALGTEAPATIEVGAHLLWQDAASAPGQTWSGFRFVTLMESQMQHLREWLDMPGGTYE